MVSEKNKYSVPVDTQDPYSGASIYEGIICTKCGSRSLLDTRGLKEALTYDFDSLPLLINAPGDLARCLVSHRLKKERRSTLAEHLKISLEINLPYK